jgi:hypothetical protein
MLGLVLKTINVTRMVKERIAIAAIVIKSWGLWLRG